MGRSREISERPGQRGILLHPVKRESISDRIEKQIKRAILNGDWQPGQKLPSEAELSDIFDVSRVTIRQALQKLTVLGLIETRVGEGSFVRRADVGLQMKAVLLPSAYLQPHDTAEVLDFRKAIEIQTAGLAAGRATPEDIAEMRRFYDWQTDRRHSGAAECAECDLGFHMAIAKSTGNSLIIATYEVLREVLRDAMTVTMRELGCEIGLPYHLELIDAIERKDDARAVAVMTEHMRSTIDNYQRAGTID